jgi:hypothetical protein
MRKVVAGGVSIGVADPTVFHRIGSLYCHTCPVSNANKSMDLIPWLLAKRVLTDFYQICEEEAVAVSVIPLLG